MRILENKYMFTAVWLYCCMYFLNIFDIPNAIMLLIGAVFCLIMIVGQKRIQIDIGVCLLTVTLASYYLIVNGWQSIKYSILYIPLMIYMLTNYMTWLSLSDKKPNSKIKHLILALVIGFTIYGLLNSYMYYAGYVVPGTRRWQDFWSHEIVPGTQHTVYFLPIMAIFFPAVIFIKEKKWAGVLTIVTTAFFCYTSLVTRSRMPIVIFVVTILVQGILYAMIEWQMTKKILLDKRTWLIIASLFVISGVGFAVVKDTAVVSAFINNLGKDGGILNNVRFVAQRQAISQLFDYPMGGRQMEMVLGNYCHNTWLDMANAAGLIPFIAFSIYTFYSAYELIVFFKRECITTEIKLIAVGIYMVFVLYFTVEPVLDASIHYLTPWIFLNSIIHGTLKKA